MHYQVLYLLQSAQHLLFEIKRLDVAATATASERFCWLHYEPAANRLTALDFEAMSSEPPFEERRFRQGILRFSNIGGIYRPVQSGVDIALRREFLIELPADATRQLPQVLANR